MRGNIMDEEKYQKELFEFEKPKRFFPKLSDFFPKADFERNVVLTLTLDRAVFITIGIIMIMVVVYALGIEAGKSRVAEGAIPAVVVAPQAAKIVTPQTAKIVTPQPVKVTAPAQPVAKAPVPAPMVAPNANKPYYTIVAATFSSKDIAMQEIAKLNKQGYNATLVQSDRYFQVCIGAYADKTGALSQKDLKKVKRLYKDAYIKLK